MYPIIKHQSVWINNNLACHTHVSICYAIKSCVLILADRNLANQGNSHGVDMKHGVNSGIGTSPHDKSPQSAHS